MSIKINLDSILESRNITIRELSEAIDITPANISILKNNRARAIRFTTLDTWVVSLVIYSCMRKMR